MSVIAAFLWRKSSQSNISTFIYDDKSIKILSQPKIFFFSHKLFTFRKETKKIIDNFIAEIIKLSRLHNQKIIIEYKIVFNISTMPWMKAADTSKYVLNYFIQAVNKLQKKDSNIKLQSQLRSRLSGKPLKRFKRELRKMDLVSRKRGTGFEYHLWVVGLHATSTSYEKKLKIVKQRLLDNFWDQT